VEGIKDLLRTRDGCGSDRKDNPFIRSRVVPLPSRHPVARPLGLKGDFRVVHTRFSRWSKKAACGTGVFSIANDADNDTP